MIKEFLETYRLDQEWTIADLYNWYSTDHPGLSCREFTRLIIEITGCKLHHPRIGGRQMASIYLSSDGKINSPAPIAPPDTRYCPRCRTVKPLADFYSPPNYCKLCNREYARSYYRAYISPHRAGRK